MARLIAGKLGERIPGTAFVVENRPGAGTLLAAENVARAAPDGASFLYASTSTLITLLVNRGSGLDPVRDFAAVTMAQSSPLLMVSRPDFPTKTLPELLALARQRPVTVSHPGTGGINHLAMALLMQRTGVEFTLVPYNGNQPSLTALVRGDVDVAHDSFFATKGLLANNSIRPIAVTSAQPAAAMPAVPTVAATVPGYEVLFWGGLMAPRGMPEPILDRMAAEVDTILHLPRGGGAGRQLRRRRGRPRPRALRQGHRRGLGALGRGGAGDRPEGRLIPRPAGEAAVPAGYRGLSPSRKAIASSSTRTASMTGTTGRASNTKAGSIEQNLWTASGSSQSSIM